MSKSAAAGVPAEDWWHAAAAGEAARLQTLIGLLSAPQPKRKRSVLRRIFSRTSGSAKKSDWDDERHTITDVNSTDDFGQTALHLAAQKGKLDAMEVLLKSGVSHSIGNNDLDTPLILAAKSWQLAAVKLLLAYGACVETAGKDCRTALHVASENGDLDLVTLLLGQFRIEVNAQDSHGETPLHLAARHDHESICRALLQHPMTSKTALDAQGRRPCDVAASGALRDLLAPGAQESAGDGGQPGSNSRKAQRAEPDPDYYEVLGLSRAAPGFTEQELRRQYRKLAVRYHPDKTGGDAEAHAMFNLVTQAYNTLADAQLRSAYDRGGMAGLQMEIERRLHMEAKWTETADVEEIFNAAAAGHHEAHEPAPEPPTQATGTEETAAAVEKSENRSHACGVSHSSEEASQGSISRKLSNAHVHREALPVSEEFNMMAQGLPAAQAPARVVDESEVEKYFSSLKLSLAEIEALFSTAGEN